MLERLHIDYNGAVLTTYTVVGVGVSATARLNFEAVMHGTFDDCGDLVGSLGVRNSRWRQRYIEVIRLDV